MRRFILVSLLLCLTATTATFAQGAQKVPAPATTSQKIDTGTKSQQLAKPKQQQASNQQNRKTDQTQDKKIENNKIGKNGPKSAEEKAWNKYLRSQRLVEKMQNKLDAARSALTKLRDQMVAEKLSVTTRITQSGNDLTTEQATALENELKKIDNKYANKISKAQMDYDNALIELERAQDRAHNDKIEYQKLGGI